MKNTDLFKVLSAVVLVNAPVFRKVSANNLPKAFADLNESGKPLIFEENITKLTHTPSVITRMSQGEDVSISLELLDVALSPIEQSAIRLYHQIIERLKPATGPYYPFAEAPANFVLFDHIKINSKTMTRNGYSSSISVAERVWKVCYKYWLGLSTDTKMSGSFDGYSRNVKISDKFVEVGCQTINRYEIEALALHLGWEFA